MAAVPPRAAPPLPTRTLWSGGGRRGRRDASGGAVDTHTIVGRAWRPLWLRCGGAAARAQCGRRDEPHATAGEDPLPVSPLPRGATPRPRGLAVACIYRWRRAGRQSCFSPPGSAAASAAAPVPSAAATGAGASATAADAAAVASTAPAASASSRTPAGLASAPPPPAADASPPSPSTSAWSLVRYPRSCRRASPRTSGRSTPTAAEQGTSTSKAQWTVVSTAAAAASPAASPPLPAAPTAPAAAAGRCAKLNTYTTLLLPSTSLP
ncbi:hypothetical protein BU14_2349s0001 [Porphyra umbilicalis]|uniref:Uncharacterized protein n=1 Tax=Porphyra umbilicalis TaxID=2786 RepID=A0A1X6NJA9_PORUM|nr:hypothetical protein BU14_2349s0001 [Porphyra umbilicalis]|eukprot:OSX68711.1 hypothetical protein BU14_2349s0001 [Porphyra umbilicalis]